MQPRRHGAILCSDSRSNRSLIRPTVDPTHDPTAILEASSHIYPRSRRCGAWVCAALRAQACLGGALARGPKEPVAEELLDADLHRGALELPRAHAAHGGEEPTVKDAGDAAAPLAAVGEAHRLRVARLPHPHEQRGRELRARAEGALDGGAVDEEGGVAPLHAGAQQRPFSDLSRACV